MQTNIISPSVSWSNPEIIEEEIRGCVNVEKWYNNFESTKLLQKLLMESGITSENDLFSLDPTFITMYI